MADNRTSFRKVLTRSLAVMAMLCIYGFSFIGGAALLSGASSTSALAHGSGGGGHGGGGHGFGGGFHGGGFHGGGFHGGGFRGGGFRGAGFGLSLGYGAYYPYGYYPYYEDQGVCYLVRQRVMTRYGWRIRRVSVCE